MKTIFIFFIMALFLPSCAGFNPITGPTLSPEEQAVTPVENPDNCKFITTVYYEASVPAWMHPYACKNVVAKGGDSYKIITTKNEMVSGMNITGITIGVYKCRE